MHASYRALLARGPARRLVAALAAAWLSFGMVGLAILLTAARARHVAGRRPRRRGVRAGVRDARTVPRSSRRPGWPATMGARPGGGRRGGAARARRARARGDRCRGRERGGGLGDDGNQVVGALRRCVGRARDGRRFRSRDRASRRSCVNDERAPRGALSYDEENGRRPTLPGDCSPSTIGANGLNFSVRNGKRCFPVAMTAQLSRRSDCSRDHPQNSIAATVSS
jgi:hypothetical protein